MAEQQNREENSPANKFGHFKVQLGSLLNRKIVLEIAALWNYQRGAVEKLENAHDAGREMVAVMEERAEITPEDISRLKRALVECNYDGVAQEMQQAFNNIHFGLTRLNGIQQKNKEHCSGLVNLLHASQVTEETLGNETTVAIDVTGVTELIEEHKGIHRELLERKRVAMDAIQTTETFLREHHAPLPANNQHETRDMIRELRNTFDYLLEWSAQRQSQLTDLLIGAEEEAQQQIHQIQDKTGKRCTELEKLEQSSQVIEEKLQVSRFSISRTDVAEVKKLIEKNKEIHRDMSEQRRIALHAVDTRYKFDHLLELSAQRQSKLTELLSRTEEAAAIMEEDFVERYFSALLRKHQQKK